MADELLPSSRGRDRGELRSVGEAVLLGCSFSASRDGARVKQHPRVARAAQWGRLEGLEVAGAMSLRKPLVLARKRLSRPSGSCCVCHE